MDEQGHTGSPGWNADPYRRHELRYWDGAAWTDHVSDGGSAGLDPILAPGAPVASAVPVAAGGFAPPAFGAATQGMPRWATAGGATTGSTRQPPPSPHWAGETRAPGAVDPSLIGQPIGTLTPWYRATPVKVLLGLAALVVGLAAVAAVIVFLVGGFSGPDRIAARPAAPAPVGFRMLEDHDYRVAIPQQWQAQVLDQKGIDALAKAARAAGANAASDSLKNTTGTRSIAIDPVTRDNVTVFPHPAINGNPGDADALASLKSTISKAVVGMNVVSLTAAASDVHGFPAATFTMNAVASGTPATMISTIIQTGDHVYELTVTSTSAERAAALSAQIVPTFAPR